MGKKYIIELLDECNSKFKGIIAFGLTQEEQISVELIPAESMTPYTDPDMEQIREEALKNGYDSACKDIDVKSKINAAYRKGLEDAWYAARKIIHMPEGVLLNIFTECYSDVCTALQVFLKYDASECIEKIRQYEQEQKKIKVGDEVEARAGRAVIIEVLDNKNVRYMYPDASFGVNDSCNLTRTGRHFPEIAEVLRKMKEEKK